MDLINQGKYKEALDAFTDAIRANPSGSDAWRQRGRCRALLDDLKGALADYDKAIELNPKDAIAYGWRGGLKRQLKDPSGALADLEISLKLRPDSAYAHEIRGMLRSDARDYKGAIEDFDRAIQINPKRSTAFVNRGIAKEYLNDSKGARQDYDLAIVNDPNSASAYANRGFLNNKLGDRAAAIADYRQALAIDPKQPLATEQLGKLETAGGATPEPQAAVPTIQFQAGDPCRAAASAPGGMPWQKLTGGPSAIPDPPPGIPAATLAPLLDFQTMSEAQFAGAASIAMEGIRILYGGMSPEQERRFQQVWAPMFDSPSPAEVEYLNRLNPLLGQFLAGREALMRAASASQMGIYDVALGVAAGSRDGYFDALAVLDRQAESLQALQAGLAQIARRIEALGNPPNPLDAKCQARRRHDRSLEGLEPADPGAPGIWTGNFECATCKVCNPEAIRNKYAELEARAGLPQGFIGNLLAQHRCGTQPFLMVWRPRQPSYASDKFMLYAVGGIYIGLRNDNWSGLTLDAGETSSVVREIEFPGGYDQPSDRGRLRLERGTGDVPPGWTPASAEAFRRAAAAITAYSEKSVEGRQFVVTKGFEFDPGDFRKTADMIDRFNQERRRFLQAGQAFLALNDNQLGEGGTNFGRFQQLFGEAVPVAESKPSSSSQKAAQSEQDAADRQETITFHKSMIELLQRNLQRDQEELERESDPARRKELAFRVLQMQSDIQAEQDLVSSYQTGQIVHTRSAFDEFAHDRFVAQVRSEAARVDAARRIAAGVERQIELLPPELRASMRQKARKILDAGTVARGDVEKARALAGAMNELIQGYWQGEAARQEEKAINEQEYEFLLNTGVMTVGSVVMGLGSTALVNSFGEGAAIAVWGPNLIGGIYGSTTGWIAGGPAEAIRQGLIMAAPPLQSIVDFIDGYRQGTGNPTAGWEDRLWEGAQRAGMSLALGAAIAVGAKIAGAGALQLFGEESALFRPIAGPAPTVQQQFAAAKFQQDVNDARSLVSRFREQRVAVVKAQTQFAAGSPELEQAERELKRLAASLNSSYHCKWLLKYQTDASARRAFSRLVDQAYADTIPEMIRRLKDLKYDVSNLKFKPTRNASSAGTSSMDLDLALDEPPGLLIFKAGRPVTLAEFQKDAQRALNEAYHQVTGFSGIRSEINLTTSIHGESYASRALLGKNINFNDLTAEEVASIGKVLSVKYDKIRDDAVLGEIAKVQARCREAAKEIDNMLLKQLNQKLQAARLGSPEAQQIQSDINYWSEMLTHFRTVSTQETNPYVILQLDRLLRIRTGGRGLNEISAALLRMFGSR